MLQEAAPDSGLSMRLPHIEKITQDPADILPAADVLGPALLVEPEGLLVNGGIVTRFTKMITGLAGQLRHCFENLVLLSRHFGDVAVTNIESLQQLGG